MPPPRTAVPATVHDGLPAGPLSGRHLNLWRSRTGTALHGSTACPSLARSRPIAVPHALGHGETIGDLTWPQGLHCPIEPDDSELADYLRHSYAAAASVAIIEAATDALPVDVGPGRGNSWSDPYVPTTWKWKAIAPPLFRAFVLDNVGVDVAPGFERRGPLGESPLPPQLAAVTAAADERASTAAAGLRALLTVDRPRSWDADDALLSLRRSIVTERVLGEYDARLPGPLWRAYVNCGASAAYRAALRSHPDAERVRGRLRTVSDDDVDVLGALDIALFMGGKESFVYHRAHARMMSPDVDWTHSMRSWLNGASFGWPASNMMDRRAVGDLRVFGAVKQALAAAEDAWDGFLTGLAAAAGEPTAVAVLPVEPGYWSLDWKEAAVLLCSPMLLTRSADGEVWILVACADADLPELLDLGPERSLSLLLQSVVDQAVLDTRVSDFERVVAASTHKQRRNRLGDLVRGLA